MTGSSFRIVVDDLEVEVVRKRVKNLNLRVSPPDGRIRISVPPRASLSRVQSMIAANLGWIRHQQAKLRARAPEPAPVFATGETHYFLGQPYRLSVIERVGAAKVYMPGDGTITLFARPGSDGPRRERILMDWYRREMARIAPPRVAAWAADMGVSRPEMRIKRMKTRWGSCNAGDRRIWLNLELIKHPAACLDYVIVHELAHFFERRHNDRFRRIVERTLPDWRRLRDELNAAPPPRRRN